MKETALRIKLIQKAKDEGFWAVSVNDQFSSGRPDMRVAKAGSGQLDIELKILRTSMDSVHKGKTVNTGLTKLQFIEIRDMNASSAPAVCLVFHEESRTYFFCNQMKVDFSKMQDADFIREKEASFSYLFNRGKHFLRNLGYAGY